MLSTDHTGQTLENKYKLERLLGEGGMGAVYLGKHLVIGKKVAVKFLHQELTGNEEAVKRFYREAQAAAAIGHKNIVDVMDVGVAANGEPYLVMEYLEGEGLADMMERTGPVDLDTTCAILEPTLLALAAAHSKEVIHRDLKPDNIFLVNNQNEPPSVKLIDFGISKFASSSDATRLTRDGTTMGTPSYMSPEQAKGAADVTQQSDVYAMGIIFYEMLTGETPFVGEQYNELLFAILTGEPRDPVEINPDFPEEAWPVIQKAIARELDDRYRDVGEMLEDIRALSSTEGRVTGMTMLGKDMRNSFLSGDLGAEVKADGDTQLAADILSAAINQEMTPVERAKYALLKGPRKRLYQGIVGGVLLLLLVSLFVGMCSGDGSIEITVKGAPKGSKIYYNDSLVPINTFRVEEGDTLVPMRVEARGWETFKVSVVPNEDQVVKVRLKGTKKAKKKKQATKAKPTKAEPKKAEPKKAEPKKAVPKKTEEKPAKKTAKKTAKSGKKGKNPFKKIKLPWKKKK